MARSKRGRLSRSGDFERAYREGRSHGNRFVVVYAFARPELEPSGPRLGLSVGRRVGGAVARNKAKRALREAFAAVAEHLPRDHDFVVVARQDLTDLVEREGVDGVRSTLDEVIREGGLSRR